MNKDTEEVDTIYVEQSKKRYGHLGKYELLRVLATFLKTIDINLEIIDALSKHLNSIRKNEESRDVGESNDE